MASGTQRRGGPSGPLATEKVRVGFAAGTLSSHQSKVVTAPVTGVRTTDTVHPSLAAALTAGAIMGTARVVSAGIVAFSFANPTPADITGGNVTVDLTIAKYTI